MKYVFGVVFVMVVVGCAGSPTKLEKSPCACNEFRIPVGEHEEG